MLGRQNAQRFLREKLVLSIDNPLFAGWRDSSELVNRHAVPNAKDSDTKKLPIIPLIGCLHPDHFPEPIPDWPVNKADLKPLRPHLDARLDLVWTKAMRQWKPRSLKRRLFKRLIDIPWRWKGRDKLRKSAIKWLTEGLHHHGLD